MLLKPITGDCHVYIVKSRKQILGSRFEEEVAVTRPNLREIKERFPASKPTMK